MMSNLLFGGWPSQQSDAPTSSAARSTLAGSKKPPSSSQPFTEGGSSSDDDENRLPDTLKGNWIRSLAPEVSHPLAAQMKPQKDLSDGRDFIDEEVLHKERQANFPDKKDAKLYLPRTSSARNYQMNSRKGRSSLVHANLIKSTPTLSLQLNAGSRSNTNGPALAADNMTVSSLSSSHSTVVGTVEEVNMDDSGERNEAAEEEGIDHGSEDSSDSELPEGFWKIEAIQDHKFVRGGEMLLHVKWAGYPFEENTWEPEKSLKESAAESVDDYFKQIGGRPALEQPKKTDSTKKSVAKVVTSKTLAAGSGVAKSAAKSSKRKFRARFRQVLSSSDEEVSDEDYRLQTPEFDDPVSTFPPEPEPGSWDHLISRIHHLELTKDGDCLVGIHWLPQDEDGERYVTRERYFDVKLAAPASLLTYYESRMTFNDSPVAKGLPARALKPVSDPSLKSVTRNQNGQTVLLKRGLESSQMSLASRPKKSKR